MLLLCLIQIPFLTSCTLPAVTQQINKFSTNSFHYEYGDSWWNHGEFWIWTENGVTYFEGSATSQDIDIDVFAEVDKEVFDNIVKIVTENKIYLWDGFSKSDNDVSDGHGFSLDFEYGKNSVHANGYMFEPKNYQTGHKALLDYLCEYAEGLPATVPSADKVSYIIVSLKDFRFDLMFDMYDGSYSRVGTVNVTKMPFDALDDNNFYKFKRTDIFPVGENERYADFNFELAQQLLEKSLEIVSLTGLPGKDTAEFVAVHYFGYKINGYHFCHAVLSDEEQVWFKEKMLSVIGLPADFDLNTLFK